VASAVPVCAAVYFSRVRRRIFSEWNRAITKQDGL
jgi:hypothetical protein